MKVLLIVDVQNDFLPSGALPVKDGDRVVPVINALSKNVDFDSVIATKDWHPAEHQSFAVNHPGKQPGEIVQVGGIDQILWPAHCIQNSEGSKFAKDLDISKLSYIVYKGTDSSIDSYSAFYDNKHSKSTGLGEYLKGIQATDLYIAGLATDYCVKYSVLDALKWGFNVHVIIDACRPVEPSKVDDSMMEMKQAGADLIHSSVFHKG